MKTNELIKKLEKFDGVKIYHQDFISLSMNGIKIATVGKIGQWLEIETNCPDEVAKTLFEYYLTPLEEREEEMYKADFNEIIFLLMELNNKNKTEQEINQFKPIFKASGEWYIKLPFEKL